MARWLGLACLPCACCAPPPGTCCRRSRCRTLFHSRAAPCAPWLAGSSVAAVGMIQCRGPAVTASAGNIESGRTAAFAMLVPCLLHFAEDPLDSPSPAPYRFSARSPFSPCCIPCLPCCYLQVRWMLCWKLTIATARRCRPPCSCGAGAGPRAQRRGTGASPCWHSCSSCCWRRPRGGAC